MLKQAVCMQSVYTAQPAQCSWWIVKKSYGPGEGSVEVSGGPCADGTEGPFSFYDA